MAVKDKSVREAQMATYRDAVAKRYAFLQERGSERSAIEKDPILRHLKAELRRRKKRLVAATPQVKPKQAPAVAEPAKKEEKPKEKPKKKEKAKKPATEESNE
jgi:RNA processing factor Prp31